MSDSNGKFEPIDIDVTDETAFKAGVVKYLQLIADSTKDIPAMKKKVEKHESIVRAGKWAGAPIVALIGYGIKEAFKKLVGP